MARYKVSRRLGSRQTVGSHRLICEKVLGRVLPRTVEIHHVNENKKDNRNENLVICENSAYHKLIHTRTKAFNACGNANWRRCRFCKVYDAPENLYIHGSMVGHVECRRQWDRDYYRSKLHVS